MLVGPTSAAMVVSSSKGAILPTTMAQLAVSNGYRTASNGTAWSFYPFVADYFDFDEYYTTSSFETAMNYLGQKKADGSSKYFIICSCGSGLFTTGGHYIVLASLDGTTIQVYDPYLYAGKFMTASRRSAGVTVKGNTVYVSKSSFKMYGNAKNYWIFSNDNGKGTNVSKYSAGQYLHIEKPVGIAYTDGYKAIIDTGNDQFWIETKYLQNNKIVGNGYLAWVSGSDCLIDIGVQIWCKETELSTNTNTVINVVNQTVSSKYTTGNYRTNSNLKVRSGPGTKYKIKKTYKKGTVFTALEIKNNWARTPSGWVCLDYCRKK